MRHRTKASFAILSAVVTAGFALVSVADEPAANDDAWVAEMREVRAKFDGEPGSLALLGDSITDSLAFWAPLAYDPPGMSPELKDDLRLAKGRLRPETWRDQRGAAFGNQSGRTVAWARKNVDRWLETMNPEVAVILFGTNDLASVDADAYGEDLREVVRRCLANGTVVLLTTIPPRHGREEQSAEFARVARDLADELRVPLIDYHAAILQRRPDDWDGADQAFAQPGADVYDVPTLIARDGVHPSNPKAHRDYSDESLSRNGFALRNAMTLEAYAAVVRRVLEDPER